MKRKILTKRPPKIIWDVRRIGWNENMERWLSDGYEPFGVTEESNFGQATGNLIGGTTYIYLRKKVKP